MLCVNTTCSICQWYLKQTFPCWALLRSVACFTPAGLNRHFTSAQEAINFAHGACTRTNCLAYKAFQKSNPSHGLTPSCWLHCEIHFQILPTPQSHPNQSSSFEGKHFVSCFQRKHAAVNKTKPTKLVIKTINPLFWFNEFAAGKILEQLWIGPSV